jgi:trimeric autotransporter adhesin
MKNGNIIFRIILSVLVCFAALRHAKAVSPAPDGCYPGYTTAEGCNALNSLTTGSGNTGVGWYSLSSGTTASYNTAVGAGTLDLNSADGNTAIGAATLLLNTSGTLNTAVGTDALVFNDTGSRNSAFGFNALASNLTSGDNCAFGYRTLENNDSSGAGMSIDNNAFGDNALFANVDGNDNNAFGTQALFENVDGFGNNAFGSAALINNQSGNLNTAIGAEAGYLIDGNENVCIGANVVGNAGENNITRIKNIGSHPIVGGINVVITGTSTNGDLPLGYASSSRRYKEDIKPMDTASESLFALKPVSFRGKGDAVQVRHYGLIAEDVSAVNPDLVVYNPQGKPETLRFDSINAMLLNEFLKEHHKVETLEGTVASLAATVKEQAAQIQRVSAQLEMSKPESRVVVNKP